MHNRSKHIFRAGTAALALLSAATAASAQDQAVPAAPADGGQFDEILVTARKRAESVQDVPISVAVVGGESLQERGTASLQDLSSTLPAVRITTSAPGNHLYIRGVGSGDNPGFEQSVGTFIDDIYHGRSKNTESSFLDLERVEILKGPQSTYFGNNAIAGAINLITRKPGRDAEGYVRGVYTAEFNRLVLEGGYTLPFSDELRVRVAGLFTDSDGWVNDSGTGRKVPAEDVKVGRVSLVWEPSTSFRADLKVEVGDEEQDGGIPKTSFNCPPPAPFPGPAGFCAVALANGQRLNVPYERAESPGQRIDLTREEYVGRLNWDLDSHSITSVTGYYEYDHRVNLDLDGVPATLVHARVPESFRQFSQELRIASDPDARLSYLAGLYFQSNRLRFAEDLNFGFVSPAVAATPALAPLVPYLPFGQRIYFRQDEKTYSAFAAVTFKPMPELRLIGGLRGSIAKKDFEQTVSYGTAASPFGAITPFPSAVAPLGAAFAALGGLGYAGSVDLSRRDEKLMPSAAIQYDVADGVMLYASYANGFKAGGFNGTELSGLADRYAFDPEKVDSYELGVKSTLLDGTMLLNAALFRSDYSSLQQSIFVVTPGAFFQVIRNVGSSVSQGAELEVQWAPDDHWRIGATGTYLDSYYKSYPNAAPSEIQRLQGITSRDRSGDRTDYAPKLSGTFDVQYATPINDNLEIRLAGNLFYSGAYHFREIRQDAYAKVDARITLADLGERWEISLNGKNLTDRRVQTFYAPVPSSAGTGFVVHEPPRNFSIQAQLNF